MCIFAYLCQKSQFMQITISNKAEICSLPTVDDIIRVARTIYDVDVKNIFLRMHQEIDDTVTFKGFGSVDCFGNPIFMLGGCDRTLENMEGRGFEITNLYCDIRLRKEVVDDTDMCMFRPYLMNTNHEILHDFIFYKGDLGMFPSDLLREGFVKKDEYWVYQVAPYW